MAGIPNISTETLTAYNALNGFYYITKRYNSTITKGSPIVSKAVNTQRILKHGTILELSIKELQLKPLELRESYWISVMTTEPLELNQYVEYNNRKFNIINEFTAGNFYIYHCCEQKNI
jgi:hypothetical protein